MRSSSVVPPASSAVSPCCCVVPPRRNSVTALPGEIARPQANVWCALDVLLKLRRLLSQGTLVSLSALCTLGAICPMGAALLRRAPLRSALLWALLTSSLGFFLFSYAAAASSPKILHFAPSGG